MIGEREADVKDARFARAASPVLRILDPRLALANRSAKSEWPDIEKP